MEGSVSSLVGAAALQDGQMALMALLLGFLLLVCARVLVRHEPWRSLSRQEALVLGLAVLVALVARLLPPVMPADLQLASTQGHTSASHMWGAGFSVILHGLFLVLPGNVATVAAFNAFVSVATVPLTYVFARLYLSDRLAAQAAAAVLACQPIAARYAVTDSPFVLLTASLLLACIFILLWSRGGGYLLILGASGWLALCVNVRSEALLYVPAVLLLVGAAGISRETTRWKEVAAAALFFTFLAAYPLSQTVVEVLAHGTRGGWLRPLGFLGAFFRSEYSPLLIAFAGLAGAVWSLWKTPMRGGCLLLLIVLISLPTGFFPDADSNVRLRHVLPHLTAWSIFAGLGISVTVRFVSKILPKKAASFESRDPSGSRSLLSMLGVTTFVLLACLPAAGFLTKRWTFELEYDFIVEHLSKVSEECVIVAPIEIDNQHRGLYIRPALSYEVGLAHRWLSLEAFVEEPRPECAVFYLAGSCYAWERGKRDWSGELRPSCRVQEYGYRLEPMATTHLSALPYAWEVYSRDPVPIGFFSLAKTDQ